MTFRIFKQKPFYLIIYLAYSVLFLSCSDNSNDKSNPFTYTPEEVDEKVTDIFGTDDSVPSDTLTEDEKQLIGNWYGRDKSLYVKIALQLKADGTYAYLSKLMIGKFHNIARISEYYGSWHLDKENSQLVLELPDSEYPLILSNRFPVIYTPRAIVLNPGSSVDQKYKMDINEEADSVTSDGPSQNILNTLNKPVIDTAPDYFTVVAAKANSEDFWGTISPPGYNYGHKIFKPFVDSDVENWEYAKNRIENDPENYTIVISDESWINFMGNRHNYDTAIQNPVLLYTWFEFWKCQMKILGKVKGTVLLITAGDAPPCWAGEIRANYDNNASNVPAKITESRFPEALELNPSQSFAGVFQIMDYLRMKYAPNVKLAYTLKTWGVKDFGFTEPEEGWDNSDGVRIMADYLNSFGVQFDVLAFNFNPRGGEHTDEEYKAGSGYFGAISRKMQTRNGNGAKVWVWKVSTWADHPSFFFRNIDFMTDEANAIGMTLGHGNDFKNATGFQDPIKTWLEEYFTGTETGEGPHAVTGKVYWR